MVSLFLRETPFLLCLYHSHYQQIAPTYKQVKVEITTHLTPLFKQVSFSKAVLLQSKNIAFSK